MGMHEHYHLGVVIKFSDKITINEKKTLCSNEECIHSMKENSLKAESNFCNKCGSSTFVKNIPSKCKTPRLELSNLVPEEKLEKCNYDYIISSMFEDGEKNVFLSCIKDTAISFDKWSNVSYKNITPNILEKWLYNFNQNDEVKELLKNLNEKFGEDSYVVEIALASDYR